VAQGRSRDDQETPEVILDGVVGKHIRSSIMTAAFWQTWLIIMTIVIVPEMWWLNLPLVVVCQCWLFDEIKSYRDYRAWKTAP
jgi:hypothetical protein